MSEVVFRSRGFAEVCGSLISVCRAEAVCLSQNVTKIDIRRLKDFDSLAIVLVGDGGGNGKGGSISDRLGI